MQILLTAFTGGQLTLIIIIASVFALLLAGNAALFTLLCYKRKKSLLCTKELQQQRDDLLAELKELNKRAAMPPVQKEQPIAVAAAPVEDTVAATEAEEVVAKAEEVAEEEEFAEEQTAAIRAQILAVKNMTEQMRSGFGFVGEEYNEKRYYVRMSYSFEARLRSSDREVKGRYSKIADEVARYAKFGVRRSFRRERIYCGRKTVAALVFRGKTLCIALALNPADYAETKYRGEDISSKKTFAATPMLLRLTSERRVNYAKYLLSQIAGNFSLAASEAKTGRYDLATKSRGALFDEKLLKITVLGEVPEVREEEEESASFGAKKILPVAEMSPLMRERFGFVGEEFDGKKYYVRYNYGFESKLRASKSVVKDRYTEIINEISKYKKLNHRCAFRQQRFSFGRQTLGLILFKGKTLCIALALNPEDFIETKYRGEDLSDIRRFEKTPMLLRLTSDRRTGYAKELIAKLAAEKQISLHEEPLKKDINLNSMNRNELFAENLLKIKVLGEVREDEASAEVASADGAAE